MADTQQQSEGKKPKAPQGAPKGAKDGGAPKGGEPKVKKPRERSDYVARMKTHYEQVIRGELSKKFGYTNRMVKAGLMRREKAGVKLLGDGEIKTKVEFSVWRASRAAIAAVEMAGGSVKILAPAKEQDEIPKGKNKRKALEAAKGGDKPKGGKPKAEAEGEQKPAEQ